ncbi:hypothetical protein [Marisediminicola sp. LYQ85]|uniref:hypothetical protein n=1 Tax=Marisediminicola sp. LYQ85 TaxID=3391062 RepID=UPI0039832DEC
MAVAELISASFSAVVLLSSVVIALLLVRRSARTAELQYSIFLAHRTGLVLSVLFLLGVSAVNAAIGIGLIAEGLLAGWSFALLAPVPLVFLAYFGHIARLPFQPPAEVETD